MSGTTIKIDGMSCQHCVMSVKQAVEAIDGVTSAEVTVGAAVVTFDESKVNKDAIEQAVQKAGYTVVS